MTQSTKYDVIIIGAGPRGIGCGAGLKTFGISNFVILERGDCIGYFYKNNVYDSYKGSQNLGLPHDKGLFYNYPTGSMNSAHSRSYLNDYCKLHGIVNNIILNANVTNVNKVSGDKLWTVTYNNGIKIHCKYLIVATGPCQEAQISKPLLDTMDKFNGTIIHSLNYKNNKQFDITNKNIFIVGNGPSGAEISAELVQQGKIITLCSKHSRRYIAASDMDSILWKPMVQLKYLGLLDWYLYSKQSVLKTGVHNSTYTREKEDDSPISRKIRNACVDLSKYGLKSSNESIANAYYGERMSMVSDAVGFIELVKNKRIKIINGSVERFSRNGIIMQNGDILDGYDVVILCTGVRHGLETLFHKTVFKNYFFDKYNNKKMFPKTNGKCRSLEDETIYFAGWDENASTSLNLGIWCFPIARDIAKIEGKWKKNMELWHWDYMNTVTWFAVFASLMSIVLIMKKLPRWLGVVVISYPIYKISRTDIMRLIIGVLRESYFQKTER